MSIALYVYEDTGPAVSNHGTSRTIVENIGWRSTGLPDESSADYVYNPIIRGSVAGHFTPSYKKYNYFKISGTYPIASRMRIKISGDINGDPAEGGEGSNQSEDPNTQIKLFYKLSDTYEQPNNAFDGDMIYIPPGETRILYPKVSTVGPESGTGYPQYLTTNTTYYTQYLVTQLLVPASGGFGNIGELNIQWYFDEYEDGDV